MDDSRFDALARALTRAGSRRRALGGLLTAALGLAGRPVGEDAAAHDLKATCKKKSGKAKKKCLKKARKHAAQHASEPPPPPPPLTCAQICDGCCTAAGRCAPGTTSAACGTGGEPCATCPGGEFCRAGGRCLAPGANDDVATVGEDGPAVSFNVLANDFDPDGDALSVTSANVSGLKGAVSLTSAGATTYHPNGQFAALNDGETAIDSFTYTVSDGEGFTDTATVTITIAGVNDAPV